MGERGPSRWRSQDPRGGVDQVLGWIQEEKHGFCGWGEEGVRAGQWEPRWGVKGVFLRAGHEQGGTPADLSLKVPLATVAVQTGLRGEAASGNVVAAVQAGEGGTLGLSLSDEGKEPSEGQEDPVGCPGCQPEWLIQGPSWRSLGRGAGLR